MRIACALMSLLLVGGATGQPITTPCNNCGVVVSIQMMLQEEQWAPLGVVSSGSSPTRTSVGETRSAFAFGSEGSRGLVVIGAAGGAVYARRPNSYQKPRWDVTIKMDGGDTRIVPQRYEPLLRDGDRVRVMGTQVELVGA